MTLCTEEVSARFRRWRASNKNHPHNILIALLHFLLGHKTIQATKTTSNRAKKNKSKKSKKGSAEKKVGGRCCDNEICVQNTARIHALIN